MKFKLQATGHLPDEIEADPVVLRCEQMLEGDKRGVSLELYKTQTYFLMVVNYITSWGTERGMCRLFSSGSLRDLAGVIRREAAKTMLPPGAGFPATPAYETRQAKLGGMMETLTLTALSDVLDQAVNAGWV